MLARAKFAAAADGRAHQEDSCLGHGSLRVELLDAFTLSRGDAAVDVPKSAQRVIAFLALHERPLLRLHVAGSLWLESSEERACANLRSALWRLRRSGFDAVETTSGRLLLAPGVLVDVREAVELAHRVLTSSIGDEEAGLAHELLSGDLLPDWYEDWVIVERERLRQLRLHALEVLCERFTAETRFAEAVEAGLAAVAGEPLRESAHRAVIKAHLAEGNRSEAVRQYHVCRRLLSDRLGLDPSCEMESLVHGLLLRQVKFP